jgi:hypoxanthine phosphoribosyltransferase
MPIMKGHRIPEVTPELLISELEIRERVEEIATQINLEFEGKAPLVLIGVLKGAFILLADLSRRLTISHSVEFVAISSYGKQDTDAGEIKLRLDLSDDIEGRHVIIVEDILDTGNTLKYLISMLEARNPASLSTCVLVQKQGRAPIDVPVDYLGFEVPDVWLVGYGLDFAEQHRTLPYIGIVRPNAD